MGDRLDRVLLARGLFDSRAAAQAAITAGRVRVDGQVVTKRAQPVSADARVEATTEHPWVSRGGMKLDAGLAGFGIDVSGWRALDVGSSTGGFTQVLLARGAAHVTAVDVGRDQFHASLRGHENVTLHERLDARDLTLEHLGVRPNIVVCDASFISLRKVLPRALELAADGADLISLFKPQFEVGRAYIGKGGIVRDEAAVETARLGVRDWLISSGWDVLGEMGSPITGGDGNREYLIHARKLS